MIRPPLDPGGTDDENYDYDLVLRHLWDLTNNGTPEILGRSLFTTLEPNGRDDHIYLHGTVYETLTYLIRVLKLVNVRADTSDDDEQTYIEFLSLTGKGLEIAAIRYAAPVTPIIYTGRRI